MSKVVTVCPHCKKANTVEKSSRGDMYGCQHIQCSHCAKGWSENLNVSGSLTKSAPAVSSPGLAELRVQVRAQLDELLVKINALAQQRQAARPTRFQTGGVEKSGVAEVELHKALANGKPVRVQTVETGARFIPGGSENATVAKEELTKALGNPKRVGW